MKKIKQRIKKKPLLVVINVFSILFTLSNICLIYSILKVSSIENFLRYSISGLLVLITFFFLIQTYKMIFKAKNFFIIIYAIFLLAVFAIESYGCGIINGLYNSIDNMYKDSYTYSTSLVVLKDSNLDKISDIKSLKIGMISDINSIDGYEIANTIISKNKLSSNNEIVEYDTVGEIIKALYDKEIGAALVTSTYVSMFVNNEEYENIGSETKKILTETKTVKKDLQSASIDVNSPFTILVMGIDSTVDDISKVTAFNSDSLTLITFNPKTNNATIVSIPRDTYATIACLKNQPKSKITHSGWYGESCVVESVSALTGINIDYYVKINFTGVVKLVDALNGVEVEVPYSFCEQNSNREWGKNTIYVEKGLQVLNGEQALALTRNRHPNYSCDAKWTNYTSSDLVRGQNQQLVINAILNKIAKTSNLNTVYSILNILGNNVDTNMTTDGILSYYNLVKKIALNTDGNVISFERLYLSTYGKYIYDALMKMPLSDQIYYEDSLNEIVKEMKVNLELEKPTIIKTFSFSINDKYTAPIIGKGTYNQTDIETVPSFKNKDVSVAQAWADSKGITINIEYKDVTEGTNGIVLSQSIPASYILSNITDSTVLNVTVANLIVQENNINTNEVLE